MIFGVILYHTQSFAFKKSILSTKQSNLEDPNKCLISFCCVFHHTNKLEFLGTAALPILCEGKTGFGPLPSKHSVNGFV